MLTRTSVLPFSTHTDSSERKREEENIRDFKNFNLEQMNPIRIQLKKSVALVWIGELIFSLSFTRGSTTGIVHE